MKKGIILFYFCFFVLTFYYAIYPKKSNDYFLLWCSPSQSISFYINEKDNIVGAAFVIPGTNEVTVYDWIYKNIKFNDKEISFTLYNSVTDSYRFSKEVMDRNTGIVTYYVKDPNYKVSFLSFLLDGIVNRSTYNWFFQNWVERIIAGHPLQYRCDLLNDFWRYKIKFETEKEHDEEVRKLLGNSNKVRENQQRKF